MATEELPRALVDLRRDGVATVLVDMDGTLLDLRFDNYFWRELVPARYARRRRLTEEAARRELEPRFERVYGRLEWYCLDFWSAELGMDIAGLKREVQGQIRFLPRAEAFLDGVRSLGKRLVLVTNAHHDTLDLKLRRTGLADRLDAIVCSHALGLPKEHEGFWDLLQQREPFDPASSVMIDDSLPVLRAAAAHGVAWPVAVSRPDSTLPPRPIEEFAAVAAVADLL